MAVRLMAFGPDGRATAHDLIALGELLQLVDGRKADDADWEHICRVCGGIIREIGASVLDSLDALTHPNLDHNSS
jgi:hypothetical protein